MIFDADINTHKLLPILISTWLDVTSNCLGSVFKIISIGFVQRMVANSGVCQTNNQDCD